MRIRALVFDFDGLICDTETSSYETARAIYEEHGVELTVAQWQDRIGTHGRPWFADLEAAIGPIPDLDVLAERRRLAHHEQVYAEAAMPGVEQFVADASDAGLLLAVASSSSAGWVMEHLDRLGLLDRFSAISCANEEVPAKPDPGVYRLAIEQLGVAASHAAAFEDSPNGIAAAKAAGLRCIAVPNRLTVDLDLSAADVTVRSFDELAVAGLDQLLAR
ncbi:MAG TPA: HAD-IA family hydrolase [Acidimicrobiales bacterium]|jgi:HAD superfamily hydrolase (TIGR01509 family)